MADQEFEDNYEVDTDDDQGATQTSSKAEMIDTSQGRKNKSLTLRQLNSLLSKNALQLSLVDYDLTDLMVLEPAILRMDHVLFVDFSNNQLVSIDWVNCLHQLKKISAANNFIRLVNLNLAHLQELDLRNNFIQKMPALKSLPMVRVLILKANSISNFRLHLCSLNYLNLVSFDIRNNKISMNQEAVEKMALKLRKFKMLRFFNMEANAGIDLTGKAYLKFIESLPPSLEMFNNQRKVYLLKDAEDQQIRERKEKIDAREELKEDFDFSDEEASMVDDSFVVDSEEEEMKKKLGIKKDRHLTDSARKRNEEDLDEFEMKIQHKYRKKAHEVASDIELSSDEENLRAVLEAKKPTIMLPTLGTLNFNLEQATHYPGKALLYLKKIYEDSEIILKMQNTAKSQEIFDEQFTRGYFDEDSKRDNADESRLRVDESIDQFLQYAQLLVDNNQELRDILVSIISKLTIIHTQEFGIMCFRTLHDMMLAEEGQRNLVRGYVKLNVIEQLIKLPVKDIPVGLIDALRALFEDPNLEEQSLAMPLFAEFFPMWLSEIKELIIYRTKRDNEVEDRSDQIDAIIRLITACLSGDDDNVDFFVRSQLHEDIAHIFARSNASMSRYVPLMDCLSETARLSCQAATDFIQNNIHLELIQDTKLAFYEFKKLQKFTADTIEEKEKMYEVFSTQIELLASLINADSKVKGKILWNTTVFDLLIVVTYSKVQPNVLTSVCYLVNQVMFAINDKEFRDKQQFEVEFEVEKRINRMQSCELLLPFLGFHELGADSKFGQLFSQIAELTTDDDDIEQVDPDLEFILETLDDQQLINLFIQIVKIIEFFCREFALLELKKFKAPSKKLDDRVDRKLHEIYGRVCEKMNNNAREDALFNCLKIPSDLVRLAVVKTLFFVPVSQLDSSEIREILEMADRQQNVGVGQTELVLSILFQILANILRDSSKEAKETVDTFKNNYLGDAIRIAFRILNMNSQRVVFLLEEESEKSMLNLSIIAFLKYISMDSVISPQLLTVAKQEDTLRVVIQMEQENTINKAFHQTPIEIEATVLGNDMHDLKKVIAQGNASLRPYNYMSFRIVNQIANLLQYEKNKEFFAPNDTELQVLAEELIETAREKFKDRMNYERQFWSDFNRDRIETIQEAMDKSAASQHEAQHKMFTKTNGLKELLHFLTAQSSEVENFLRANSDPAIGHAGSKEKHIILGRGLQYEMEKKKLAFDRSSMSQINFGAAMMEDEETLQLGAGTPQKKKKKLDSKAKMLQSFMYSEIGSGFIASSTDLYLQRRHQTVIEQKIAFKKRDQMGIQNDDLRALSISALMRCLFASIESAPGPGYFDQALNNIRLDEIFRKITELCSSTGWIVANIGTKYLQVMRYVMRMDPTARLEDMKNLLKYEILSIVVRRIVGILEVKIRNVNNNQEIAVDEQIVLCHVAIMCNTMISQAVLFDWADSQDTAHHNNQSMANSFQLGTTAIHFSQESVQERQKREALTSHLLDKLFPLDFVETLIEAVFAEMKLSQDRMHGLVPDLEVNKSARLMYSAGDRMVEHSKKFLSRYIAHCSQNRYSVNHYIMTGVLLRGNKSVRTSFIEEILEGANQLIVSEQLLRQMDDSYSLSFHHYNDITSWLKDNPERGAEREMLMKIGVAKGLRDQIRIDHYLGERILITMPMQVHIASTTDKDRSMAKDQFMCLTVMLTNHGVYLINDEDLSFRMDPSQIDTLPCPELVYSFNYKSIKRLIFGHRIQQRMTLKVQSETADAWWAPVKNLNKSAMSSGMNSPTKTLRSPKKLKKPKRVIMPGEIVEKKKEFFLVTLIVPSMVEMLQMRELFELAVDQAALVDKNDEDEFNRIQSDMLIQMLVIDRIVKSGDTASISDRHCPFCERLRNKRDCECDYHISYCFMIPSHAKCLARIQKSNQRGGTVRLLSTDPFKQRQGISQAKNQGTNKPASFTGATEACNPTMATFNEAITAAFSGDPNHLPSPNDSAEKPQFGLLLISPTDFWFFHEHPGFWKESADGTTQYEKLFNLVKSEGADLDEIGGIIPKTMSRFSMSKIESLRIITSKVPAIELEYRMKAAVGSVTKSVVFSMQSDFFTQETLVAIKRMKKLGKLNAKNGTMGMQDEDTAFKQATNRTGMSREQFNALTRRASFISASNASFTKKSNKALNNLQNGMPSPKREPPSPGRSKR